MPHYNIVARTNRAGFIALGPAPKTNTKTPENAQKQSNTTCVMYRQAVKQAVFGSKTCIAAFVVLLALYAGAVLAEFVTPYAFDSENRKKSFHPPVKVHFFDTKGNFSRPFVYDYKSKMEFGQRTFTPDETKKYPVELFISTDEYKLCGILPLRHKLFGVKGPAMLYLLGADWNGRDIFSRLVFAARISLSIGLIGVVVSFTIGTAVGMFSGYFGGMTDTAIMRTAEVFMSVPSFFLMLALRAVFPLDMSSLQVYMMIVIIMSLIGWAGFARIIRGLTLSIKTRDFVLASKALGTDWPTILSKHILPNLISFGIVSATLSIPAYILAESALSVLGLGITEPHASWGNMLARAMNFSDIRYHPWILSPGAAIFATIFCFNTLGQSLQDALDPKRDKRQA